MRIPLAAVLAGVIATPLLMAVPSATASDRDSAPTPKAIPTFVIAGFGDSYGSGEGAPHSPGKYTYYDSVNRWLPTDAKPENRVVWTPNASREDERCHRSPKSGLNQAALLLEFAFRGKVNIKFRNFACSGGAIRSGVDAAGGDVKTGTKEGGILAPYEGMQSEKRWGEAEMSSQVEQANAWAGTQQIDAALVNVGGNDAGFGRMLFLCGVNWYLLGPLAHFAGGINECAEYKNGVLVPSQDAQRAIDLLEFPVSSRGLPVGYGLGPEPGPMESYDRCTFLTHENAAAGTCLPVLPASYALLAQAARADANKLPTTYTLCELDQESWAATDRYPNALIGAEVTVPTGAVCRKHDGFNMWSKVAHTYPKFTKAIPNIYINTYPEGALTDSQGNFCDQSTNDPLTREIRKAEAELFQNVMVQKLNSIIYAAAVNNTTPTSKWTVVKLADATGHGICADAADRWFNLNLDALKTMGEAIRNPLAVGVLRTSSAVSSGWAHPNAAGFKNMYAYSIAEKVRLQICAKHNISPCPRIQGSPIASLDGDIYGKVRSIDFAPVAATVTLTNTNGDFIAQTTSDAITGNYRFEGIAVGAYEVTAVPLSSTPPLAAATGGAYIAANSQVEVNLTLDIGASITGKVYLPNGLGAGGVTVNAYLVGVNYPNDRPSQPTATDTTDRNGAYTFPSLGAATIARIEIVPSAGETTYKTVWYKTGTSWTSAQTISLEEGYQIVNDPVTLTVGLNTGTLTGTAYTDGGFRAEGARVAAYSPTLGKVSETFIDENGRYTLEEVPIGPTYVLFDTDPASEDLSFQPRWYPDATSQGQGELVNVGSGTTTLNTVDIPRGADITVVVADYDTGEPIEGVSLTLLSTGGAASGISNADGRYVFKGLPTNTYRLFANPRAPHIPEWYERATSLERAEDINVEAGYSGWASIELRTTPEGLYPEVVRNADRSFSLTWEPEVGADSVHIQRRLSGQIKWANLVTGLRGVEFTDSSARALRASGACYRTKATASTGASSPWTIACS
jgi:hypothetical protein